MSEIRKRLTLSLLSFAVLSGLYSNCGRVENRSTETTGSEVPYQSSYNGGGHSGKVVYTHTNIDETCSLDWTKNIVFEDGQVKGSALACDGLSSSGFSPSEIRQEMYDPYFLVADQLIYGRDDLMSTTPGSRVSYSIFCSNPEATRDVSSAERGIDFAVRIERTTGSSVPSVSGVLVVGYKDGHSTMLSEPGILKDPDKQGVMRFIASSYQIEVQPRFSATEAHGIFRAAGNSQSISLSCFLKPLVADHP